MCLKTKQVRSSDNRSIIQQRDLKKIDNDHRKKRNRIQSLQKMSNFHLADHRQQREDGAARNVCPKHSDVKCNGIAEQQTAEEDRI
ncbi:hypothetical protein D3C78_1682180 [compost metagenome]